MNHARTSANSSSFFLALALVACSKDAGPVEVQPGDTFSPADANQPDVPQPDATQGAGAGVCLGDCRTDDDCGEGRICRGAPVLWRTCVAPGAGPPVNPLAAMPFRQAQVQFRSCREDAECTDTQNCSFGRTRLQFQCEVPCANDSDCNGGFCVDGYCGSCRLDTSEGCTSGNVCVAIPREPSHLDGYCAGACSSDDDCAFTGQVCRMR